MQPIERPHAIRTAAAREAMRLLDADASQFYMCVRGADEIIRYHGAGGVAEEAILRCWGRFEGLILVVQGGDVDHIAPFDTFGSPPEDLYKLPVWEMPYGQFGFRSGACINVRSGLEMRGYLALLRRTSRPWAASAAERRAAAHLVMDAFRAAWDLEVSLSVPQGVLLVSQDGVIRGDAPAEAWVERVGAGAYLRSVAAVAAACAPGESTGRADLFWAPAGFLRRQVLPGGLTGLALEPVRAGVFPEVIALLTPSQRRVAAIAAAGATTSEIGVALGISVETVRSHIAAIYQALGIGSRAELSAKVQRVFL